MKIIGADARLAEKRGAKILIVGPAGVGKTSLLRTLDHKRTLFVEVEAGDLAVQDLPLDTVRIDDWPTARNLACRIGGPNPSFPPTACYSQAHFEAVGGPLENLGRYDIIFVDSITAISRLSFRWAEQQPEAFRAYRRQGPTRCLRPPCPRNVDVASPAAARAGEARRLCRHSRKSNGRFQSLRRIPASNGGRQGAARDRRHRR